MTKKVTEYFNYSNCKKCGGRCCQSMAGSYHPDDFKAHPVINACLIKLHLHTGKYAIDWWEGDPTDGKRQKTYYLRPRHKNEPAIKGSWGGHCIHWTAKKGCDLKESERPYECRMLVPKPTFQCSTLAKDKADKKNCAIAWYPYQAEFDKAIETYEE
jgi:Fe-S-cluster containining protein